MVKVFAPASIGNIGPGFDVLGLAVENLGDEVEARLIDGDDIVVKVVGKHTELSIDPNKNTASIAAMKVMEQIGVKKGMEIILHKNLPIGSGLGSSAASAVAGAYAANEVLGGNLSKEELLIPATIAESKVSGGFFADNTAPSMLGGATLTRSYEPFDVVKLGSIDELRVVLVTPHIQVLTKHAREILPEKVLMEHFVSNMANACLMCAAFSKNDYGLFARSLHDKVIEPVRSTLIKGFDDVKKAAIDAGADGCTISGSGPTMFSVTNNDEKAELIRKVMVETFAKIGVGAKSIVTTVCFKGARIVD